MIQPRSSTQTETLDDRGRRKVLVVDDDLPLRGMLTTVLRRHGFQVFLAGDGAEAQRVLVLHHPHIVLLDLMMPGINGWDFLQILRDTGHLGRIPIIVISAHLRNEPQALLEMGVSAILPKPFNLDELLEMIRQICP
ncbi:MAG TPA: response regulator [Thermoanaerobaculia bacterium]|nr:response regulator [Thermoanaerobaculia bacterium]